MYIIHHLYTLPVGDRKEGVHAAPCGGHGKRQSDHLNHILSLGDSGSLSATFAPWLNSFFIKSITKDCCSYTFVGSHFLKLFCKSQRLWFKNYPKTQRSDLCLDSLHPAPKSETTAVGTVLPDCFFPLTFHCCSVSCHHAPQFHSCLPPLPPNFHPWNLLPNRGKKVLLWKL